MATRSASAVENPSRSPASCWPPAPLLAVSTSPGQRSTECTTSALWTTPTGSAEAIRAAGRVAVIGAGWIGSEVAASARQLGADVVLIDPLPVPLQRVLGDEIGAVFAAATRRSWRATADGDRRAELRGATAVEQSS